ncbi:hypothetical protein D3C80_1934400 [compost metagenome]
MPMTMVAMAGPLPGRKATAPSMRSRDGEMRGFMKSIPFIDMSAEPSSRPEIHSALCCSRPNISSSGRKMKTASRLKKSCTVAAAKARRNSSLSRM